MTVYSEILDLIANGGTAQPTSKLTNSKDILEWASKLFVRHLGCTSDQYAFVKYNASRKFDNDSKTPFSDYSLMLADICSIEFYYYDSDRIRCTMQLDITMRIAHKPQLIEAFGTVRGTKMTTQAWYKDTTAYILSVHNEHQLIIPGNVALYDMIDRMTTTLKTLALTQKAEQDKSKGD